MKAAQAARDREREEQERQYEERQLASCAARRKARFESRAMAKRTAKIIRGKNGHRLEPYECPCGWWHLTTVRKKAAVATRV